MSTSFEKPRRVLIVDDHPLYRNGLKELLAEGGFKVCGEGGSNSDVLQLCRDLRPDLLTLELSPSHDNSLDLVEKIRAEHGEMAILITSPLRDRRHADRAFSAGAKGYICKQASADEFRAALRALKNGQTFHSDSPDCSGGGSETTADASALSAREMQIFRLIGQGDTTQSIAKKLELATSTIETYRERIKSKLNIASGAELTRRAILWVIGRS